jgi:hypothetical protein
VEPTLIRQVDMSAMLVGPDGDATERVEHGFREARVKVIRMNNAGAACEALPVAMPQVVVILGSLLADERAALADRATAVGALVLDVDPELDDETLDELIGSATTAAITRKLMRDDSGPAGAAADADAEVDVDVDEKW